MVGTLAGLDLGEVEFYTLIRLLSIGWSFLFCNHRGGVSQASVACTHFTVDSTPTLAAAGGALDWALGAYLL